MYNTKTQSLISEFVTKLNKHLPNAEVYLYGSAMTSVTPGDIDIIVKADFRQVTADPEMYLYDIYSDIPRDIDFQVYGLQNGAVSQSVFLNDAMQNAKRIQ